MKQIRDVLRLALENGLSHRQISACLGIARGSVKDYLTRSAAAGLSWPLPIDIDDAALERRLFPPLSVLENGRKPEPDWAEIHEAMKLKGATLQGVHLEYLACHPDGLAYSSFCQVYRDFKQTLKRYMRQTHAAGDKVFVDYAGPTLPVIDPKTDEKRMAQIFVGVLGASSYIYAEAVWSQQLPNWIASHVRMFEHFGGVPQVVVCDNLKSAVTRASRTDPDVHPTYLDMASHYGTVIFPARPYKPKDKSKAENGVLIVERWIMFRLRKRVFTSLAELNRAISDLLTDANSRPFQKLKGCRREAFEKLDRPALKPLPQTRYAFTEFLRLRVGLDYHIEIAAHHYSVPCVLVRQAVDVRLTADTVEVLHGGRRVASHARGHGPGRTTDPLHMDPAHRHLETWTIEDELDWAISVGPNTHMFLQGMFARKVRRDMAYRSVAALKSVAREVGPERLEAACTRALQIGATEIHNVKSILRTNMDRMALPEPAHEEATFDHPNVRGAGYYCH